MTQDETPITINAPDWDTPPGTDELKTVEQNYGALAKDLKDLAGLVEKADAIFREHLAKQSGWPDEKDTVIIKTKRFRAKTYYVTCLTLLVIQCLFPSILQN